MDPLKQGSGHVRTILPLDEPIALPPDVLVEQRGAELLEARGRVLERREDRLALVDLQAEDRVSLSSARRSRSPAGWSARGVGCCRSAASTRCSAHYRHRAAGMQQTNGTGQRLPRLSGVVDLPGRSRPRMRVQRKTEELAFEQTNLEREVVPDPVSASRDRNRAQTPRPWSLPLLTRSTVPYPLSPHIEHERVLPP
jgi:hypothetical protein